MPTCGYICPQCEGKEILDDGTPCDWCSVIPSVVPDQEKGTENTSPPVNLP